MLLNGTSFCFTNDMAKKYRLLDAIAINSNKKKLLHKLLLLCAKL